MLRELGRRALDRGDRAGAEGAVRGDPRALIEQGPARPGPSGRPESPRAVADPGPARDAGPGGGFAAGPAEGAVAVTLGRFRQAAEFAGLAAEAGLADLSLKAVRDALKGGAAGRCPSPMTRDLGKSPCGSLATGAPVEAAARPGRSRSVAAKLVELDAALDEGEGRALGGLRDPPRRRVMPPGTAGRILRFTTPS